MDGTGHSAPSVLRRLHVDLAFHVKAKLFVLVGVSGWSLVLRVSITSTSSFSASSHRPWFSVWDGDQGLAARHQYSVVSVELTRTPPW